MELLPSIPKENEQEFSGKSLKLQEKDDGLLEEIMGEII
jgi:hypothetical protein